MGGLAQLAAEKGIKVSGCDENVYPPMDQVLLSNGIAIDEGYIQKIYLKMLIWLLWEML